ncbi:MAG: hypothetical protein B6I18_01645 [Bacteroidetes bacterium 4572_112]|nr:MAG: hypothetical protein B6I18_01645 [Bacteroidetes bacterium 4572_112]
MLSYQLEFFDTDGDGLKFFANNDGTGYIRFRKLNNQYLKNFQADFGRKFVYNFTVNYPLSYEQTHAMEKLLWFILILIMVVLI